MLAFCGLPRLEIHLDNGLYLINSIYCTGITHLYNILYSQQQVGSPVMAYTFRDHALGAKMSTAASAKEPVVIILDEVDKYSYDEEFTSFLNEWKDKAIVLVSLNSKEVPDLGWKQAKIEITKEKVTITQCKER